MASHRLLDTNGFDCTFMLLTTVLAISFFTFTALSNSHLIIMDLAMDLALRVDLDCSE
jgi:hypothetical protein